MHSSDEERRSDVNTVLYQNVLYHIGIIYRNVKLDSVLLDREGHVKLCDFTLCKVCLNIKSLCNSFTLVVCNTGRSTPRRYNKLILWRHQLFSSRASKRRRLW